MKKLFGVIAFGIGSLVASLALAQNQFKLPDGSSVAAEAPLALSVPITISGVPASLTANGSWTSSCISSSQYRAFDAFAAIAAAGTLQVQRYIDSGCVFVSGAAVPSTALALTSGGGCPTSTNCGDVASNDGQPFAALKITLTDTSGSANAISAVLLNQGAE